MNMRMYFLFPNTAKAMKMVEEVKQKDMTVVDTCRHNGVDIGSSIPIYEVLEPWLTEMVLTIFLLELLLILLPTL